MKIKTHLGAESSAEFKTEIKIGRKKQKRDFGMFHNALELCEIVSIIDLA